MIIKTFWLSLNCPTVYGKPHPPHIKGAKP